MSTVTTKHIDIFEYWKGKVINRRGDVRQKRDDLREPDWIPVVNDWSEPSCWACGKPIDTGKEADDPEKIWGFRKVRERLNRCHIVPDSCGGFDQPDNLFLLCSQCHVVSPDTTNRAAFLRWVFRERKVKDIGWPRLDLFMEQLRTEVNDRGGLSLDQMMERLTNCNEFSDQFAYDKFYKWAEHRSTTHCTRLSESTMVVLWADYIEYVYNQLIGAKT